MAPARRRGERERLAVAGSPPLSTGAPLNGVRTRPAKPGGFDVRVGGRGRRSDAAARSGGTTSPRPEIGRGLFVFGKQGGAPLATEGSVNVVITAETAIELVPVMRERLADLETPVSAFAKLRALGGAFLFESAEGGERMGRYSFIGVAPLRKELARYHRAPHPGLPRFSGGAVGFVGYEAARRFERLPLAAHDPYGPWGVPEMVFGIYDTVVAFDHLRHTLTVLAHDDTAAPGAAARTIDRVFAALDAPLPV